jgi:hypothetical protein
MDLIIMELDASLIINDDDNGNDNHQKNATTTISSLEYKKDNE